MALPLLAGDARWGYEQSLHNPAVVPADDGFLAHRQLLESYQQIRQETLEVALSGRLPANHSIMQQQRTLYEFDRKILGMLPLRGYGYNYPANQALIPSLRSFLQHHPDIVSAAIKMFPPDKVLRPAKAPSKVFGEITCFCTWRILATATVHAN